MTKAEQSLSDGVSIMPATEDDIPEIQQLVVSAFTKYIERIGKPPAPMLLDWHHLLLYSKVYVLRSTQGIVGGIVLKYNDGAGSVEVNSAVVDPAAQGRGYGRMLMEHAEEVARSQGIKAVTLYTNAKMYENLSFYPKIGYVEVDRRTDEGYDRVYYRKELK